LSDEPGRFVTIPRGAELERTVFDGFGQRFGRSMEADEGTEVVRGDSLVRGCGQSFDGGINGLRSRAAGLERG